MKYLKNLKKIEQEKNLIPLFSAKLKVESNIIDYKIMKSKNEDELESNKYKKYINLNNFNIKDYQSDRIPSPKEIEDNYQFRYDNKFLYHMVLKKII